MRKNIMLIIGTLTNGGAEHSIINLANALSLKHNVFLVAVDAKECDYDTNLTVIELKELGSKKTKLKGIKKLKKLKREYNIDTSISYMTALNFYNVLSKSKEKTIISIRNHMSSKKEGALFDILEKISIRLCDLIVCCSKSVKSDMIENYHAKESKVKVVTNFYDPVEISSKLKEKLSKEEEVLTSGNYFVTTARMVPHKGHAHVIKAFSKIVKENRDAKLLIFGRGPLEEELKKFADNLNIRDNVIFMGFSRNIYKILKNAKALILASEFEGFPNVLVEAMASGTPVIATDVPGGSKEIITNREFFDNNPVNSIKECDYGILIPGIKNENSIEDTLKMEEALEDAMKLILRKEKYEEYHEKSLTRAKDFTRDKVIIGWEDIL